jgi:hypothetical protein
MKTFEEQFITEATDNKETIKKMRELAVSGMEDVKKSIKLYSSMYSEEGKDLMEWYIDLENKLSDFYAPITFKK